MQRKFGQEAISQSLAILSIVLETISGVILFLVWTIYAGIEFVNWAFYPLLLWIILVTLILTVVISSVLFFGPLSGFLSNTWKIFISSFLAFIVLSLTIIVSLPPPASPEFSPVQLPVSPSSSIALIALFTALVLIFYLNNYTREEELLRMVAHKRLLNKLRRKAESLEGKKNFKQLLREVFRSWDEIVRSKTFKRVGLSESLFLSLLVDIAFWGALILVNVLKLPLDFSQGLTILVLLIFLIVIFLVDILRETVRTAI